MAWHGRHQKISFLPHVKENLRSPPHPSPSLPIPHWPTCPCRPMPLQAQGGPEEPTHHAACIDDLPVPDIHEIVVPLPDLLVEVLPPQVLVLLQDLSHVFNEELTSLDRLKGKQAKALLTGPFLRSRHGAAGE